MTQDLRQLLTTCFRRTSSIAFVPYHHDKFHRCKISRILRSQSNKFTIRLLISECMNESLVRCHLRTSACRCRRIACFIRAITPFTFAVTAESLSSLCVSPGDRPISDNRRVYPRPDRDPCLQSGRIVDVPRDDTTLQHGTAA